MDPLRLRGFELVADGHRHRPQEDVEILVVGRLADGAPRGHWPDGLHRAAPDRVHLVYHVAHHAAMVRHHLHHLANLRPCAAAGEIDDAVLFGESDDLGLWGRWQGTRPRDG